jgi:hypothetical protein
MAAPSVVQLAVRPPLRLGRIWLTDLLRRTREYFLSM